MAKITLNNIGVGTAFQTAIPTINTNNDAIETAFENTLSRDGTTPNTMSADFDMNGYNILNLPQPTYLTSPLRLQDISEDGLFVTASTGTSGHTVPFLDGNNTWSGTNTFSGVLNFTNTTEATGVGTTYAALFAGGVEMQKKLYVTGEGTFGPGGTGVTYGRVVLNGGSGAAAGAFLHFRKNSTNKFVLGHRSAIAGSGTSDNLIVLNYTDSKVPFEINAADSAIILASTTTSTSTTTGALTVAGGLGVAGAGYLGSLSVNNATLGASTKMSVTGRALFYGGTPDSGDSTPAGVAIGYNSGSDYGWIQAILTGVATKELRLNPVGGNTRFGGMATAGLGGTGSALGVFVVDGGSGSSGGGRIDFQRNSTAQWFLGHESAIAVSASNDFGLANNGLAAFAFKFSYADNSLSLLANVASTSTTTGTLKVTGGVGVTGTLYTAGLYAGTSGTSQAHYIYTGTSDLRIGRNDIEYTTFTHDATYVKWVATTASKIFNVGSADAGVVNLVYNNTQIALVNADGLFVKSGAIGYVTGAGGSVTQATSKSTAVTLDKATGKITMNNAALAAATIVSFTLNNTKIATTDLICAMHESGGTLGAYTINARATGSGTASIDVRNNTGGSLSEAVVIRFAVIKSVDA